MFNKLHDGNRTLESNSLKKSLSGNGTDPAPINVGEKGSVSTWLPIVISTLSLLVSLSTFYYTNWREKHSVQAVIAEIDYNTQAGIQVKLVVRNLGNRTEVLSKAQFIYGPTIAQSGGTPSGEVGPSIVKPDEAVVLTFTTSRPALTELRDKSRLDPNNRLHVGVVFSIIDFRAGRASDKIYLTKVVPFTILELDGNGTSTGAKPDEKEDKGGFAELYTGSAEE
jgi:hypothetical protein